ncbi:peptidase M56 [Paenibacillus polysaccharolyticus]|uniref:M56 family metallopeptidase n=1 Tax=Paenibacillus polysaccharolyticus TaxID=582692 RepID=UPI00203D35D5|nr:M56 family metallopeptidase [Paenibacillus polysaccharolyticus]MCM3131383.1 peptidase M56 [Paenibacillus polysaccharolyticus]
MNLFIDLLITLTAAGSIATACILALRLLPVHLFPASWRYALSKMAVIFYVLPLSFGITWFSSLFHHASNQNLNPSDFLHGMLGGGLTPEWTISSVAAYVLLGAWGVGVLGYSMWQIYCYYRFVHALKRTQSDVNENSEAALLLPIMKEKLGIRQHVNLAYSPMLRSPVLVGLTKPTIYLPQAGTACLNMSLVYHHELTHLKHKDLWVKALTLTVSALHWFNPLVHLLRQEIHTWSEFSCDAKVVQKMSIEDRKRYGETILNVTAGARSVPVQFCSSLSGEGKQLKRRLTMMFDVKKMKKKHRMITIASVCLIAAASTSTAVWASSHTPKVEQGVTEAIIVPNNATETASRATEPSASKPQDEVSEAVTVPDSSREATVPVAESRVTSPRDELSEATIAPDNSREATVRAAASRPTSPRDKISEAAIAPDNSREATVRAAASRPTSPQDKISEAVIAPDNSREATVRAAASRPTEVRASSDSSEK